mmetsp:Transcript_12360/g.34027  ORF Transcript_12360/g.34027 Transcript_12360/m.34027 type:complete len:515 (-) Transcript_12360:47-1591(-)|eukprot:CAMPEP_0194530850 /NCGR_PEP_ID=MMETSP0253-20130528/67950_1 /TAXON_ID=2966 /ORGANISM="Noctiluca scintillans" /LENGTH=514 /DNA_ID=CAMNT_0039376137 /DNA_START=27 /DNA_END=1571 /DNA_ORIENTATION=+
MSRFEKYLEIPSDTENTRLTAQDLENRMRSMKDFERQDLRAKLKEVAEDLAWLPEAACDPDAERAAARIVARGKLVDFKTEDTEPEKTSKAHFTIDHVCGPAVQIAFWANVFGWGSYVVLAPLGVQFYQCAESASFATFSPGGFVVFALLLATFVILCMWLEFKCARYYLPAHVAICGRSANLSFQSPFWILAIIVGAISLLGKCDLLTNSFFVAKMIKSHTCHEGINKTWAAIWSQSFLWCPLDFWQVVICVWFLMLLQPLYAFLYCCPLEGARLWELVGWVDPSNETYKVKDRDLAEGKFGKFATYKCCMDEKSHCGDALVALSYAGRLSSDQFFVRGEKRFLIGKGAYMSGQIYNFLKQQILFSLVFQMLVLFCQVEMTGTAIELLKSLDSRHRVDAQLAVGVSLNVVMGFKNVIATALYILELAAETKGAPEKQKGSKDEQIEFNKICKRRTSRLMTAWVFCTLVFAVGMVHAITKLVMVTRVCDGGWNAKWPPQQGCVPVHGHALLLRV